MTEDLNEGNVNSSNYNYNVLHTFYVISREIKIVKKKKKNSYDKCS